MSTKFKVSNQMKKFHELNPIEKKNALENAKSEIENLIFEGFIHSDTILTEKDYDFMYKVMAETSNYNDSGEVLPKRFV